jgi:hypothetical protein
MAKRFDHATLPGLLPGARKKYLFRHHRWPALIRRSEIRE